MADSEDASKDEVLQLLKRFGTFLNLRFSHLFPISLHHQNTYSIGALAGLAIAIIFTWKILRPPATHRRRRQRQHGPAAGNVGVLRSSEVNLTSRGPPSADSKAQEVVDEFFQPMKLTLGQVVRQKLGDGRKVTCRLLGVILEENSPEELQNHATVKSSVLEVLLEIARFCDIYLMERILDDESGERVLQALDAAGVFTSGGLVRDKVLFCSTENGRSSFARQLEPDWHIDTSSEIISQLARFIKYELHISPNGSTRSASNVFSSASLEQFFGGSE